MNGPAFGADPLLVIGANGFLGSHLVDALAARGQRVRAFDRFSSPPRFAPTDAIEVVAGDFFNRADLHEAVVGCGAVFHFLSSSTPATSVGDPTYDLRTNVTPTVELLGTCADEGVGAFFFASSGGTVYGPGAGPLCREDDATRPISPYGIGKATIESYLKYFRATSGLNTVSLRIANPYGPRQGGRHAQGLIPIALRSIRENGTVRQLGDGRMVRDYLHVQDLVTMILTIAESAPEHDVYNLGSGQGVSVKEILGIIHEVTGTDFEIETRDQPASFVERSVLDISRYRREWGEPPTRPLSDGISEVWRSLVG
jgi:UDP-glucose 4-epimerase